MTGVRGFFLTFEGIEGCGKSTQAARVAAALRDRGFPVVLTRDPGGTPAGERIRDVLLHTVDHLSERAEAALYAAARAELVAKVVAPALARGEVVVCDRFEDSFVAYQGYARGLGAAAMRELSAWATGDLSPDLTILLDLPVAEAFARVAGQLDRVERESLEFHEKVREGFLAIARERADRIVVIDARAPEEAVFERVMAEVLARLPRPA